MIYHTYNRSIADFEIFGRDSDSNRIIEAIRYYQYDHPLTRLSQFLRLSDLSRDREYISMRSDPRRKKIVDVIAYCIMPGHLHIAIQELKDNSVSTYTANVLNSYARYFNSKYNRKGPLWESRTKKVLVNTDEQLLYLTMYIHLNPVAAGLVKKPEDWPYSSYKEYIKQGCGNYGICNYSSLININPKAYRKYVESNIEYQKDLARQKAISNTS